MFKLYTVALAVIVICWGSVASAQTAEEMVSACGQVSGAKITNGTVMLPRDFDTGFCWGAFASFQQLGNLVILPATEPLLGFCAPKSSTRTQLIAIFMDYARRNPKRLNENFETVALGALRQAFPCHSR